MDAPSALHSSSCLRQTGLAMLVPLLALRKCFRVPTYPLFRDDWKDKLEDLLILPNIFHSFIERKWLRSSISQQFIIIILF